DQAAQSAIKSLQATAKALQADNKALHDSVDLLNKEVGQLAYNTQFISADATFKTTTISRCNLYVQSGSGSTDDCGRLSGLGNLIIGYNASREATFPLPIGFDLRLGSHNLILGDYQNYSSFGGIVAGFENNILAPYASVTGGLQNTGDAKWS